MVRRSGREIRCFARCHAGLGRRFVRCLAVFGGSAVGGGLIGEAFGPSDPVFRAITIRIRPGVLRPAWCDHVWSDVRAVWCHHV